MNKNIALMVCVLLSACNQVEPSESLEVKQKQTSSDQVKQKTIDQPKKTAVVLAAFAYQEVKDQRLDQQ